MKDEGGGTGSQASGFHVPLFFTTRSSQMTKGSKAGKVHSTFSPSIHT